MNRAVVLACAAALTFPFAAAAQNAPPSPVTMELNLGFVNTSGNTDVTSFNFGEKLTYKTGRWLFTQQFRAIYGETDGTPTAEAYEGSLRGDRAVAKRLTAFGFVAWNRNPFAGIAERWAEGAGMAYKAIEAPRDTLTVEDALSLEQQRSVAGTDDAFTVNRAGLAYKHMFGAAAAFTQTLEWLANFDVGEDQRINSESVVTAPISKQISMRVSYLIRFDNLPEPGFEDTDRVFTTGLQIVF